MVENEGEGSKIGQEQIQGLLFGDKVSWQAIIYDLINTEQLDPWDVDLVLLSNRYLERVRELEEANFFVSSKVLFAAALLLRIKSEILLNKYIPSLDDILFGKKENSGKSQGQERIELDEDIPDLIPRTPLPRFKKVTLEELMAALGKAIKTENRRIRHVVVGRQQELETSLSLPKKKSKTLTERISAIHKKVRDILLKKKSKMSFTEFAGEDTEDRLNSFIPLLYLDTQHKILLEQEGYLREIWIWLKDQYENEHRPELEKMKKEVDEFMEKAYQETEESKVLENSGVQVQED